MYLGLPRIVSCTARCSCRKSLKVKDLESNQDEGQRPTKDKFRKALITPSSVNQQ